MACISALSFQIIAMEFMVAMNLHKCEWASMGELSDVTDIATIMRAEVDFDFYNCDLVYSIDAFSQRHIAPACARILAQIEKVRENGLIVFLPKPLWYRENGIEEERVTDPIYGSMLALFMRDQMHDQIHCRVSVDFLVVPGDLTSIEELLNYSFAEDAEYKV